MEVLVSPGVKDKPIIFVSDLRQMGILNLTFLVGKLGSNNSDEDKDGTVTRNLHLAKEDDSSWGI